MSYLVSGGDGFSGVVSTQVIDPMSSYAGPGTIQTNRGTLPVLPSFIGPSTFSFNYSKTYIPEPGTAVLGFLGLAGRRFRG
ncbi:MAG TPA: hypothetical protein VGS58_19930 [Candidatus Sulfopaludibacter sp.]|nr:hypothetical protein [Candidatus Sulfopaludibacter sp.]